MILLRIAQIQSTQTVIIRLLQNESETNNYVLIINYNHKNNNNLIAHDILATAIVVGLQQKSFCLFGNLIAPIQRNCLLDPQLWNNGVIAINTIARMYNNYMHVTRLLTDWLVALPPEDLQAH